MNISKLNNCYSFGKKALLTCEIKQGPTKNKVQATLYKMDPHNLSDIDDVRYSKQTMCIQSDFSKAIEQRIPNKDFYILRNDKTKEVISCAQTSHHYRTDQISRGFNTITFENPGLSTLIEEMNVNPNYVNGAEPLLAYIVKAAGERFDSTVYTAFDQDVVPSLKRAKFSQTKLGEFFIPEKRYSILMDQAEKHSQIEYLV